MALLRAAAHALAQRADALPSAIVAGLVGGIQAQTSRCKHTVRVVLLEDHEHLGQRGEVVSVAAGYARQALFPRRIADYAVPSVLRELQAQGVLRSQPSRVSVHKTAVTRAEKDPAKLPMHKQLPELVQLLSSSTLVASRRVSLRHPDKPMVGSITAKHLSDLAAHQLHVFLPPELICMRQGDAITAFGSYRVPINLRDPNSGQQLELAVTVRESLRSGRIRHNTDAARAAVLLQRERERSGGTQA